MHSFDESRLLGIEDVHEPTMSEYDAEVCE